MILYKYLSKANRYCRVDSEEGRNPSEPVPSAIFLYLKLADSYCLHNINSPILSYRFKFQVDISVNRRITAVQSLESLYTFIL